MIPIGHHHHLVSAPRDRETLLQVIERLRWQLHRCQTLRTRQLILAALRTARRRLAEEFN